MKVSIIRELPNVEASIKDVNNTVCNNPENKKRNREIDVATLMLFKDMVLLKNFLEDPVTTASTISKSQGDLPYAKDFVEIFKAVNGVHTKDQGIVLGKNKIITNIKKIAEEIKSKYKTTETLIMPNLNVIDETLQLIDSSFEAGLQQRRYQQATENYYFTQFTRSNIDKFFVPESISITSTMPLSKFLVCCLEIYSNTRNTGIELARALLKELDTDLTRKIAYFNLNNKYMGSTQFNKTQIVYPEPDPKILRYNNPSKKDCYLVEFIDLDKNLPQPEEKMDKLQVLKQLVDLTISKRHSLISSVQSLKEDLVTLASKDLNIPAVVDSLISTVVEPMVNVSITLEDYSKRLDEYKIVLHNMLNVYDKVMTTIDNIINVPTNAYYISDRIYKLIDKTLIKSSMEKGQEKKPTSIVYDTAPQNGDR